MLVTSFHDQHAFSNSFFLDFIQNNMASKNVDIRILCYYSKLKTKKHSLMSLFDILGMGQPQLVIVNHTMSL